MWSSVSTSGTGNVVRTSTSYAAGIPSLKTNRSPSHLATSKDWLKSVTRQLGAIASVRYYLVLTQRQPNQFHQSDLFTLSLRIWLPGLHILILIGQWLRPCQPATNEAPSCSAQTVRFCLPYLRFTSNDTINLGGESHREIFDFVRVKQGKYRNKEWEMIVLPVIRKWGQFTAKYL